MSAFISCCDLFTSIHSAWNHLWNGHTHFIIPKTTSSILSSFLSLKLLYFFIFVFFTFYFLYFCIIYRSFPNTSENVIFHLPEAEPGDLFGCTFLSQGKGVILHKSDFVDLVILGPVMVECCSLNPKQEQYKDTKGSFTCPQHKKFGFPSSEPALSCSPKHSWSRAGPHWHLSTGTIPLYPKIPWRLFQYLLPVHGIPLTPLI